METEQNAKLEAAVEAYRNGDNLPLIDFVRREQRGVLDLLAHDWAPEKQCYCGEPLNGEHPWGKAHPARIDGCGGDDGGVCGLDTCPRCGARPAESAREFWACLDAEGTEFLCPHCGAIVSDVNLHAAWHEHSDGNE